MKHLVLATAVSAMTLVAATTVQAENNWDGPYVGVSLGGAIGQVDPNMNIERGNFFNVANVARVESLGSEEFSNASISATARAGYLIQSGNYVYGIEGDVSFMNYDETDVQEKPFVTAPAQTTRVETTVDVDWIASVRPKVGMILGESNMVSLSAGPALARVKHDFAFSETSSNLTANASNTENAWGVAVGLGYEHKLSEKVSLTAGYDFYHFSDVSDINAQLSGAATDRFHQEIDLSVHTLKIGLNYAF